MGFQSNVQNLIPKNSEIMWNCDGIVFAFSSQERLKKWELYLPVQF